MNKKTIPERYFIIDEVKDELDLIEVSKERFEEAEGKTETERHTVFTNGVDQICHTKLNGYG